MTRRKALFSIIVGMLAAWIFINTFFEAIRNTPSQSIRPFSSNLIEAA
jgi:hypothetical protein